jgi:flagellar biogenesis protein FliO
MRRTSMDEHERFTYNPEELSEDDISAMAVFVYLFLFTVIYLALFAGWLIWRLIT